MCGDAAFDASSASDKRLNYMAQLLLAEEREPSVSNVRTMASGQVGNGNWGYGSVVLIIHFATIDNPPL